MAGRDEIERVLVARYGGDARVLAAYLFGSQAAGRAGRLSDTDIAFHLASSDAADHLAFVRSESAALSRLLDTEVDLILLNEAGLFLRMQVIKKGSRVLENDPRSHRRFLADTFVQACDFLPYWERLARRVALRRVSPHVG